MRKSVIAVILMFAAAAAFGAGRKADPKECPPRYSYCGYSGPEQWRNLPIDRNECGGKAQSPVDIIGWEEGEGSAISVSYTAGRVAILNTGHDIEVKLSGDSSFITIGGNKYFLRQLHFHVPNEHAMEGDRGGKYKAELHLVHGAERGNRTAVIAVLLTVDDSRSNPVLAEVIRRLPMKVCNSEAALLAFQNLLPATIDNYFTYDGSLTTPPCSQTVTFYIANGTGLTLSQEEYDKLESLGENARPLQPINGRPIRLIKPGR